MQIFDNLGRHGADARRQARYSVHGMAALLAAGFLVPAPGNVAVVAIAGTGLALIGAQRFAAWRTSA